jgi:hypothetical protein
VGTNKQFNAILDECLDSLLTGKETVEQCLERYPQYVAELEPLLRTAVLVNKAVDVKPSADFRAKARYQLQTMMAKSKAPRRAAFVPRWAIAVCTMLLIFVLGGGTVLAADNSMPGSPLYGVKLVTENLSIKLAGTQEEKVELYATVADRRVTEMVWMADNNKTANMEASVQRLNTDFEKIGEIQPVNATAMNTSQSSTNNSLTAPMDTQGSTTFNSQSGTSGGGNIGSPVTTTPNTTVATTTAATTERAKTTATSTTTTNAATVVVTPTIIVTAPTPAPTILVTAPPAASMPFGNSAVNTYATGNSASANNKHTVSANDIAKLKNTLMYYAKIHPEKIQELLDSDKVPESVKPDLRRALAASKAGYQNAISNLGDTTNP